MNGIELIAAERQRQIHQEGWTPEHDQEHIKNELALAASCYALPAECRQMQQCDRTDYRVMVPKFWPWLPWWWKPSTNRIDELVKAGALIAAEIDRLQRKGTTNE